MADCLDPQMQEIINNAAASNPSMDILHPSYLSNHLNHNRASDSKASTLFKTFPVGYDGLLFPLSQSQQTSQTELRLDEFEKNLLYENESSHQPLVPINLYGRLSMPFHNELGNNFPLQPVVSQHLSRQPVNQFATFEEIQARLNAGQVPQYPLMSLPGTSRARAFLPPPPTLMAIEKPIIPFKSDDFKPQPSTKTTRQKQNSSPSLSTSSPIRRITLRRAIDKPTRNPYLQFNERPYGEDLDVGAVVSQRQIGIQERKVSPLPNLQHVPPIAHGIQLVSPNDLPDSFRPVFPYPLFNAVQSKCIDVIFKSTDNVVISAPTGSGKTVMLELAICKLVECHDAGQFKVVYQAPTKSLCVERVRDWRKKFRHLNLLCAELTGDTDTAEMRTISNAAIIVTTPEKWDSITRKWKDHFKLLQMVKLFLIDEIHILKDIRGGTLEAVVSRMKSIGAAVRFVALSATVPNSQDIASWLGRDPSKGHIPAHRETFGENFRPVRLEKYVYGFDNSGNDFAFDQYLDSKLPNLIVKHARGKPMMVFCFTRKACESTATKLVEWWAKSRPTERAWPQSDRRIVVNNSVLKVLVLSGVAFHHAGLESEDRAAVETAFLEGGISVICCTSTLAVGVNLPCHLVVIKNTVGYQDDGLKEYSDLELMQMLGRAGRPQFDQEAVAVIVTRKSHVDRYQKMISGQEIVESTLHLNLIEHLNSEIGLGTVHNAFTVKKWLAGTFLSVRMRQNPTYYKFNCDNGSQDADERLERIGERDVKLLQDTKLITCDRNFSCTLYGLAMSKFMISFETMKLLLSIPKHASLGQILHIICQAAEFKDLRIKANERHSLRELNKSSLIRFQIKENIATTAHKVSLIIQIQLGGVDMLSDKEFGLIRRQYLAEKSIIFERIQRLVMCTVECKVSDCDGVGTCNALELSRSISAGYWESSPLQMRQIEGIGPAAVRKLVHADIKSIGNLSSQASVDIERILSRNPPFGKNILSFVHKFPRLILKAEITRNFHTSGSPVRIQVRATLTGLAANFFWKYRPLSVTFSAATSTGELAHIWRGNIRKLINTLDLTFTCTIRDPTDAIVCQLACDNIIGTLQSVTLHPGVPNWAFPKPISMPILSDEEANFYWDETEAGEFIAAVHIAEGALREVKVLPRNTVTPKATLKQPESDYGLEDYDFLDLDVFNKDTYQRKEKPLSPVQRTDGRWECNHACRVSKTKKGEVCKHNCCRDGLEKPSKAQKKKSRKQGRGKEMTERSQLSAKKVASKMNSRPPNRKVSTSEVEAVNLAEVTAPLEYMDTTLPHYLRLQNFDTKIQDLGRSIRPPKQPPLFLDTNDADTDLEFLGLTRDNSDIDDDEFSSPAALMKGATGTESELGLFHHNELDRPDFFGTSTQVDNALKPSNYTPLKQGDNFAEDVFDFDAFQTEEPSSEQEQGNCEKRGPPSSPFIRDAKRAKQSNEGEVRDLSLVMNPELEKPLPDWTNEIAPNLMEFFKGFVDFAP